MNNLTLINIVTNPINGAILNNVKNQTVVIESLNSGITNNIPDLVANTTLNVSHIVANTTLNVSHVVSNTALNITHSFLGMDFGDINGKTLAIIGAAAAVSLAGIASAVGAGIVGATGARESAEDPKSFSTALLFQALPQTQGIYGFLIAILIMLGAGIIGAAKDITLAQGLGAFGAGLAVGIAAISAIGQGLAASAGLGASTRDKKMFGKSILFSVLPETQALYGFLIAILILVGFGLFGQAAVDIPVAAGWAAIGAGLAIGIAGVSAIGQGIAAAGGIGAVLEKSKSFGKAIIFAVLPETQALYGFIIAILILIGFGILGKTTSTISFGVALFAIAAGLSVGLAAISAIGQGIAAASGVAAVSKNDKSFGKAILFSVLPETQALYGFLIAILLLVGAGVLGAARTGITTTMGVIAIGAGLASGIAGISAIGQGIAAASGIKSINENPKSFGKAILFSVLPETQALYGFLIAILLLVGGGILGTAKMGLEIHVGLIAIGAGLATGLAAISAIGQGIAASSGATAVAKNPKSFGKAILFSVLPETQALYGFLIAILLLVGGGIIGTTVSGLTAGIGLVAIGSGVAVGLAAVSAVGQGMTASSGISATAENEKMFGRSILFSVLPETQALYGFLIAVLLLVGGGLLGAVQVGITTPIGIIAFGASLAVGLAGVSAIGQGMAAASGISAVSEKSEMFGKSIIFSIIPETQALMGFLIAILIMIGSGLMGGVKYAMGIPHGYIAIGAGLAIGLAAISAFGQGFVVSSAISATTKNDKNFGKSLLFSVLPQTQSLYGFLISILLLVGGGLIGVFKPDMTLPVGLISIGAGIAVGLAAVSAIGQGIVASSSTSVVAENEKMFGKAILFSVLPETQALYGFLVAILLIAAGGILGKTNPGLTIPMGLVAVGAGISIGIACISALGQGIAAASGVGSVSDKEKMFGKSILFSVLPETQALYGIIISVLMLTGVGLIGTLKSGITLTQGIGGIGIGITMGLAAVSAVGQGIVASSSIGAAIRDDKSTGKSLVLSVIPETYAIFGLLISILMLIGLKFI
ncbi:MAG: hypothetical protein ABIJ08_02650 [Nanoarchaeota archaeon]